MADHTLTQKERSEQLKSKQVLFRMSERDHKHLLMKLTEKQLNTGEKQTMAEMIRDALYQVYGVPGE